MPRPRRPKPSPAPLSPCELELLDAFVAFRELAPWEWLANDHVFGIEDPASGEVNWATVMGAGGGLFGLGLYLGERGHRLLRRVVSGEADYEDVAYGQDALLVTLSDWIEADEASVERWRAVWPEFREDAAVPYLESHAFGRIPRAVDEREMAVLAHALRQVVRVAERVRDGEAELERAGDGPWLVRRWSEGEAVDRREASPAEPVGARAEISEADVDALRSELGSDGSTVELDLFPANSVIQDEGDGEPWMAACLLEVDAASGMVLAVELGRGSERERWALEHLVGAWRERGGIPGRVVVRERTAEWLADALVRLGVTVFGQRPAADAGAGAARAPVPAGALMACSPGVPYSQGPTRLVLQHRRRKSRAVSGTNGHRRPRSTGKNGHDRARTDTVCARRARFPS